MAKKKRNYSKILKKFTKKDVIKPDPLSNEIKRLEYMVELTKRCITSDGITSRQMQQQVDRIQAKIEELKNGSK